MQSFDLNGVLGQLTGRSERELEAFFRRTVQEARGKLERAKEQVAAGGGEVRLDASAVSGVNGGDGWVVRADGVQRVLDTFPGAEAIIGEGARPSEPCRSLAEARPLLIRCAYNGLWSPSGTNWQPVRTLELTAAETERLCGRSSAALLVLSQARYQSILGDVAALAGREPTAGAEFIDPGIWLEAARLTARGHGWELEPVLLAREDEPHQMAIAALLQERTQRLAGGAAAQAAGWKNLLLAGELVPVALLLVGRGPPLKRDDRAPVGLALSELDRLCEARCTQRVASPAGGLEKAVLEDLLLRAAEGLEGGWRPGWAVFSSTETVPAQVGQAMHQGLEGEGGLLSALGPENLKRYLSRRQGLSSQLAAWVDGRPVPAEGPEEKMALPAACLPRHLLQRLCADGGYRPQGEGLVDSRGRPLTVQRLCRLTQLVARGFGKFFLSFQNTHPLLAVLLLSEPGGTELQRLGALVERLTLLARARGLVSIIKSGPLEIAGPRIRSILDGAGAPPGRPVLTFQLGLPLGPEEKVCAGTPAEHDGLQERLLDRRAGRASLAEHYLLAPEGS